MQRMWSVERKPENAVIPEKAWNNVLARANEAQQSVVSEKRRQKSKKWLIPDLTPFPSFGSLSKGFAYATVFLLLFSASYFVTNGFKQLPYHKIQQEGAYRVINVKKSERLTFNMSEGTLITLDAGSQLKIFKGFEKERRVYLKGEAYFEVTHNPQKPFHVQLDKGFVKVLGTKFNIRAWDENPIISVAVAEGRVQLSRCDKTGHNSVVIPTGYMSTLPVAGRPTAPVQVNVQEHLAWRHNEIHFHDASLKEILAQLERWYDFDFEVADSLLQKDHLDVHIKRTNVDDVIELLSIITKTNIVREGKRIRFVRRQSS